MRSIYRITAMLAMSFTLMASGVQAKPNVVIITANSLGWGDVGFNGGAIETPAIDGLVQSGVNLERFYVAPLASPTRVGLMTGRQPLRVGVAYSEIKGWDNVGVHYLEHFMPQSFKDSGYQTAMIGAWGMGHAQQSYHPNLRGFDEFIGHQLTGTSLNPPYKNAGGVDFQHNGKTISAEGYEPRVISSMATEYVRGQEKGKPFFLWLAYTSAGKDDAAPAELMAKYQNIGGGEVSLDPAGQQVRASYAASIDAMDQGIEQVLQALADEGLAEDTIVFFMSDSGGRVGKHGNANNGAMAGGWGDTLEGGIHVPAALVWPGKLSAGNEYSSIVTAMDVFPTIAAAAGVQITADRKLDGVDMWAAISEGKSAPRNEPVVFASEASQYDSFDLTAFDDEWKLVQKVRKDLIYIEIENYLYRVGEGVNETENLATQYPGVVEELTDSIKYIRRMHPITGLRNNMVPPPGYRGPLDWAEHTLPLEILRKQGAAGSPPPVARRPLDYQLGEKGRLIYDCEIKWWSLGFCISDHDEDVEVYRFHEKD